MRYYYLLMAILTYFVVVKSLSKIELKKIYMVFYIFIWSLVMYGAYMISEPLSAIFLFLGMGIFIYISSKKIYDSILYAAVSFIIMLIVSNLYFSVLQTVTNINYNEILKHDGVLYTLHNLIVILLLYVISKAIGLMIHHRKLVHVNLKHNKITYLALTYILISLIQVYILTYFFDLGFKINLIIVSGSVFVLSLLLFLSYLIYSSSSKEEKLEKKQMELQQLATYTDNLEIIYNDMRKMRHDYMNVLASMIGYMEDRDLDALIEYYNNHVIKYTDKMKEADLRLGRLSHVKQSELKGIIALKVIQAQERNIQVNVDVVEDISFPSMDMIDLCRVVGILLDNAIEGAAETEEPLVELGLIKKENSRLIVITNTCKKPEVSIYTLYKEGFSTKGEDRGLGLSNLKDIINKYPKVTQETIINDGMFIQFVEFLI